LVESLHYFWYPIRLREGARKGVGNSSDRFNSEDEFSDNHDSD
jgi:hypothetical protein